MDSMQGVSRTMKAKAITKCKFMEYTQLVVDYMDTTLDHLAPYKPFGQILRSCKCEHCMELKEVMKRLK